MADSEASYRMDDDIRPVPYDGASLTGCHSGNQAPSEDFSQKETDGASGGFGRLEQLRKVERLLLGGENRYNYLELMGKTGISEALGQKLWAGLGFSFNDVGEDMRFFTDNDVNAFRKIDKMLEDGKLSKEGALSIVRSFGQMMDRMIVWQIETLVEEKAKAEGISDGAARKKILDDMPYYIGNLEDLMDYSWRRLFNAALQRLVVRAQAGLEASEEGRTGTEDDRSLPLARAVGFADLVSYTKLARCLDGDDLARLVQRFETICAEIVIEGNGRLVKTNGDEVLFITEDPFSGADIALKITQVLHKERGIPDARVAMVWGRVLSRMGDIYGSTVNLAARLTERSQPGSILVDALTAGILEKKPCYKIDYVVQKDVVGLGDVKSAVVVHR